MNIALRINLLFLVVFVFIFVSVGSAQVPQKMNYEGTLTDTDGNPVPDGTYEIQFSLYSVLTGGTPLWTEAWNSTNAPVIVTNGKFNVLLGTHNPIPVEFFNERPAAYLGIKVGTDDEMLPRQQLVSVPYAMNCNGGASGWNDSNETWVYAGADDPEFTLSIAGDQTGKYSAGMKIRLTQTNTIKYFIVTKVEYSSPDTILTLFGGTDYDLTNALISNPAYARIKAPQGFSLQPSKWTVTTVFNELGLEEFPAVNVWYNLGSASINIPTGAWYLSYSAFFVSDGTTGVNEKRTLYATLSTADNSETDPLFTVIYSTFQENGKMTATIPPKVLEKQSKTTYYLNFKTNNINNLNGLQNYGKGRATLIQAVCAHL